MEMKDIEKTSSYTSANALPVKIFTNKQVVQDIVNGHIAPLHVQLSPTNRCNLKCDFCSFKNKDVHEEISGEDLGAIVNGFHTLGTKAITITGGGEPLLHNYINVLISSIYGRGIKAGLVTNGVALDNLSKDSLNKLTWMRISFDSSRTFTDKYKETLDRIVGANKNCDLAFSYVLYKEPNITELKKVIDYGTKNHFTHIRIVEDLFDGGKFRMSDLEKELSDVDTSKVIFQGKKEYVPGMKNCLISLIKPFVAADGFIYPCCGITYALDDKRRKEPTSMRMGHWVEMFDIWGGRTQKNYDGTKCIKCYYPEYNHVLNAMISDVKHKEFI